MQVRSAMPLVADGQGDQKETDKEWRCDQFALHLKLIAATHRSFRVRTFELQMAFLLIPEMQLSCNFEKAPSKYLSTGNEIVRIKCPWADW